MALYIGGIIVAIMGIALLFTTVKYYNDTFTQAVAAGYDAAQVSAQLMPSQLLPGVFQAIGVYGGIAMMMLSMGMIYQKVANHMKQANMNEINIDSLEINVDELTEIEEIPAVNDAETVAVDSDNKEIAVMNEQPAEEKL